MICVAGSSVDPEASAKLELAQVENERLKKEMDKYVGPSETWD